MSAALPEDLFQAHQRYLWGLCYRMTGNAADADDVVQETFVRALEHPPEDTARPWRPWLTRVAVNLARDRLRRRRRQAYTGPWLPSPIETASAADEEQPEARYGQMESVTLAFLLALETLTPQQRAVLVLRDVYDRSVRETAATLGMSEANVKVTHHRARRVMRAYDTERAVPTPERRQAVAQALMRLVEALTAGDAEAVAALLTEDARTLNDGGGEFLAALNPVEGRERVARFYVGLRERSHGIPSTGVREINGLPALVVRFDDPAPRTAPRAVLQIVVAEDGRVRGIYTTLASDKLRAVQL